MLFFSIKISGSGRGHVWLWITCLRCCLLLVKPYCLFFSVCDLGSSYIIHLFSMFSLALLIGSIKELVKIEKNGLLFSSSSELADELLVNFNYFVKIIFFMNN